MGNSNFATLRKSESELVFRDSEVVPCKKGLLPNSGSCCPRLNYRKYPWLSLSLSQKEQESLSTAGSVSGQDHGPTGPHVNLLSLRLLFIFLFKNNIISRFFFLLIIWFGNLILKIKSGCQQSMPFSILIHTYSSILFFFDDVFSIFYELGVYNWLD